MRILLVTAEYPPAPCGGIGIFYRELARQLAALGAQVHVLSVGGERGREGTCEENGVGVSRVELGAARSPRLRIGSWRLDGSAVVRARELSSSAQRLVQRLQPDVVETHDWSAPLWRAPSHPFVVRLHGASSVLAHVRAKPAPRLLRFLERRMAAQASALVAVSAWAKEKSAEVFGIEPARIEVIPNGVDTDRFRPGAGARCEEVVFAGTLRADKGVPELLQALEIVLRHRPAATATLAGGPDAWRDLPSRIRASIERLHMAAPDRLRLLGRVSQEALVDLYRRAGVCVFPSRAEAFGLACVEAMSCGAAVIASPLGAGAEVVEDERSGLLTDPRDPVRLADAILRVLRQPDLGRNLGDAARRRVMEKYSIQLTAERTLEFYERTLRANQLWRKQHVA